VLGMCARSGCLRRRAVNQLTGQLHDHCSIDCMRQDQAAEAVSSTAEETGTSAVVLSSYMRSFVLLLAGVQPTMDPSAETFISVQCASPGRGGELIGVCDVCAHCVGWSKEL